MYLSGGGFRICCRRLAGKADDPWGKDGDDAGAGD